MIIAFLAARWIHRRCCDRFSISSSHFGHQAALGFFLSLGRYPRQDYRGGGRREFRFQFSRGFSSSKWNFSKMGFLPIWSFPLGFSSIWNCFAQDPRRRLETSGLSYIRLCTNMKICNFACILIYSAQTNEFHLKRTKYRLG